MAKTISGGLVDETRITPEVIFAGLVGAILWNLLTWLLGLPSSSSHALFGGLIGATWVVAGSGAINFSTVVGKVLVPLALSPIVAGLVALTATYLAYRITARGDRRTRQPGLPGGAGGVGLDGRAGARHQRRAEDHGRDHPDADHRRPAAGASAPPLWVVVAAGLAIALGTAMGGWRIIRTLGKRISDIQTPQGFAAETASTAVILGAAHLGFALSTTQVATGAILGAAAGRRWPSVRWRVAGRMALAWLLTLPAAATVGGAGRLGRRPRRGGNRAGRRRRDGHRRRHLRRCPGAGRSPPPTSTTPRPPPGRRRGSAAA